MITVEITSLEMVLLWDALREFRHNTVDAIADQEAKALLKKLGCTQIDLPEPEMAQAEALSDQQKGRQPTH